MKNRQLYILYVLFSILFIMLGVVAYFGWDINNKLEARLVQTESQLAENKGLIQGVSNEIGLVKQDTDKKFQNIEKNVSTQGKQIKQVEQELGVQLTQLTQQKQELEKLAQKEALEQANIENAKKSVVVINYIIKESDGGGATQTFSILCSGVVYKQDNSNAHVVTNQHCIDWQYLGWSYYDPGEIGQPEIISETVEVSTINGVKHTASNIVKAQDKIDLATLIFQKSSGESFTIPTIESSLPNTGDEVVAIGTPSGLAYTTTKGIVSATRQASYIEGGRTVTFIQTDAAINPGNSGGGLFRLSDGVLVGINTFTFTDTEGLNFAISTKSFKEVMGV